MTRTPADPEPDAAGTAPRTDYAAAVAHYASPRRRDAVKREWEEPLLRRLLDGLLSEVDVDPSAPLRVLDVGCGGGAGLGLLDATRHLARRTAPLEYVGLDPDPHLLELARAQHAHDPRATFVRGDVRDGPPIADVDVHLSSGVPYSHLAPGELEDALTGLLAAARGRSRPTALIVDVLGRYSAEWTARWDRRRWPYRMSFFEGDGPAPSAQMTVYDGQDLREALLRAAGRAGCTVARLRTVDRSILVGRHSTTGEYADGLPPIRTLVNRLWDPEDAVDPDELRVELSLPAAPAPVQDFYAAFTAAWNDVLRTGSRPGPGGEADQAALARRLRRLEVDRQRGLGAGHSLTGVLVVRPG